MHFPIRSKIDDKARSGILLKILPTRNYLVWDIQKNFFSVSRQVQINYTVLPKSAGQESEVVPEDLITLVIGLPIH